MNATAATQEKNREMRRVERAFECARDRYDRAKGNLDAARTAKKPLRVIEIEGELAQAAEVLRSTASDYERVCGVPVPLSAMPQPKPGSVVALCAANPELRAAFDKRASCEHQINLLEPQIEQIEKALAAQGGVFVSPATPENSAAETTLDLLYPERVGIRVGNSERLLRGNQNDARLRQKLADLKQELEKAKSELAQATAEYDALLSKIRAGTK
jgi:hypothetical protein